MVRVDQAMVLVSCSSHALHLSVLHTEVLARRGSSSTFLQALRPSIGRGRHLASVEIAVSPELCLLSIL